MTKTLFATLALVIASSGFTLASTEPMTDKAKFTSKHEVYQQEARRKQRVPGGSGCDDAGDAQEHPECRG